MGAHPAGSEVVDGHEIGYTLWTRLSRVSPLTCLLTDGSIEKGGAVGESVGVDVGLVIHVLGPTWLATGLASLLLIRQGFPKIGLSCRSIWPVGAEFGLTV